MKNAVPPRLAAGGGRCGGRRGSERIGLGLSCSRAAAEIELAAGSPELAEQGLRESCLRLQEIGATAVLAIYLSEELHFSKELTGWMLGTFGFVVWFLPVMGGALEVRGETGDVVFVIDRSEDAAAIVVVAVPVLFAALESEVPEEIVAAFVIVVPTGVPAVT